MKRRRARDTRAEDDSVKLIGAMNRCFATEDGKHVLTWLMHNCGWNETSVVAPAPGIDVQLLTYYNEARRAVYVELRSLIRADILKDVEFPKETEQQTEENQ